MRKLLACLAVLLGLPVSGMAEESTGYDFSAMKLRNFCTNRSNNIDTMACLSFINGFRDGMMMGRMEVLNRAGLVNEKDKQSLNTSLNKYSFSCIPQKVSTGQLREVFIKYMGEHPENLHEEAIFELSKTFIQYFPCKSK